MRVAMIVKLENQPYLSKTKWLLELKAFDARNSINFLQQRGISFGIYIPINNLESVLRNWWDEISISHSKEIIITVRIIRKNLGTIESSAFLIVGEDADDFIKLLREKWKDNLEALDSIDVSKKASEPKTKSDPPPVIRLPGRGEEER